MLSYVSLAAYFQRHEEENHVSKKQSGEHCCYESLRFCAYRTEIKLIQSAEITGVQLAFSHSEHTHVTTVQIESENMCRTQKAS